MDSGRRTAEGSPVLNESRGEEGGEEGSRRARAACDRREGSLPALTQVENVGCPSMDG